jgi:hypothetical protein
VKAIRVFLSNQVALVVDRRGARGRVLLVVFSVEFRRVAAAMDPHGSATAAEKEKICREIYLNSR